MEIFGQKTALQEYKKRISELEQLIGHKEMEIALSKSLLAGNSPGKRRSNS
jgi:transposase